MLTVALPFFITLLAHHPFQLPEGVHELKSVAIKFPVHYSAEQRGAIKKIHLYVSTNFGKDWKAVASAFPTEEWLSYNALRDGMYWFSLQIEKQDGTLDPPQAKAFEYVQKVYFNTAKRKLLPAKPAFQLVPPPKD